MQALLIPFSRRMSRLVHADIQCKSTFMKRLLDEVMTRNYQVMKCIFTPLHPFLANLQKNLITSAHSLFPFSHTPSLCQYESDVYSTKRAVVCNRNSFNFDGLFGLIQYLLVSQAHRLRICLLSSPPYSHSFHYYGKLDQNGDLLSVCIHSLCAPQHGI